MTNRQLREMDGYLRKYLSLTRRLMEHPESITFEDRIEASRLYDLLSSFIGNREERDSKMFTQLIMF